MNFMLNTHTEQNGYTEVIPPFVANQKSMEGTGQLPKFAEDMYHIEDTDLYLIPTAEVPVTNMYRESIIDGEELPLYRCAYTPCFRAEERSSGTRHQGAYPPAPIQQGGAGEVYPPGGILISSLKSWWQTRRASSRYCRFRTVWCCCAAATSGSRPRKHMILRYGCRAMGAMWKFRPARTLRISRHGARTSGSATAMVR